MDGWGSFVVDICSSYRRKLVDVSVLSLSGANFLTH